MPISEDTKAGLAPEIVWWTPSTALLEQPERFLELATALSDADRHGAMGIFHGEELDRPASRVSVTVWKSLSHHQDFMSQESYADIVFPILEAMAPPYTVNQAIIQSSHSTLFRALCAPVTQFIYLTLRPLHDINYELVPLLEKLRKVTETIPACIACCWGPSIEKDKLQVGIIGWSSVEGRNQAVEGPLSAIIQRIREMSSIEIRYASFVMDDDA